MPDLEKVIKGLECCMSDTDTAWPKCEECPYNDTHDSCASMRPMFADALALLKAQEPRVMTLDELSEKTDVYFESLVYDTICPALSAGSYDDGTVGLMTLEDELFYMDEADYGVQWRCWTSRPTDEQRRDTPWE